MKEKNITSEQIWYVMENIFKNVSKKQVRNEKKVIATD